MAVPLAVAPDGTVAGAGATGFGNTGYGFIVGPGEFNFDAAIIKNTRIGGIHENGTVQFRAEFFNLMNHAQFGIPRRWQMPAPSGRSQRSPLTRA